MNKAERYIKRQTAHGVISLIIKDIEKLGRESKKESEADEIIERLKRVQHGLIGA